MRIISFSFLQAFWKEGNQTKVENYFRYLELQILTKRRLARKKDKRWPVA